MPVCDAKSWVAQDDASSARAGVRPVQDHRARVAGAARGSAASIRAVDVDCAAVAGATITVAARFDAAIVSLVAVAAVAVARIVVERRGPTATDDDGEGEEDERCPSEMSRSPCRRRWAGSRPSVQVDRATHASGYHRRERRTEARVHESNLMRTSRMRAY